MTTPTSTSYAGPSEDPTYEILPGYRVSRQCAPGGRVYHALELEVSPAPLTPSPRTVGPVDDPPTPVPASPLATPVLAATREADPVVAALVDSMQEMRAQMQVLMSAFLAAVPPLRPRARSSPLPSLLIVASTREEPAPARVAVAPARAVVAPTCAVGAPARDPVVSSGSVAEPRPVVPPPASGGPPSTSTTLPPSGDVVPPAVAAKLMVDQARLSAVVAQRSLFAQLNELRMGDPLETPSVAQNCPVISDQAMVGHGLSVSACRELQVPRVSVDVVQVPRSLAASTRNDIPAAAATQPRDTDVPPFGMIVLSDPVYEGDCLVRRLAYRWARHHNDRLTYASWAWAYPAPLRVPASDAVFFYRPPRSPGLLATQLQPSLLWDACRPAPLPGQGRWTIGVVRLPARGPTFLLLVHGSVPGVGEAERFGISVFGRPTWIGFLSFSSRLCSFPS
eukprot:jgi/Mesvir1/24864/Mv22098-RA.1